MDDLQGIIKALQRITQNPRAFCALLSSDCVDESSIMGTKDGYINLALAILQIVESCEGHSGQEGKVDRVADRHAYWSGRIKNVIHQLPVSQPYIVGCYVFDNHQFFIKCLEEVVNPSLPDGAKLSNDPAFKEP